MPMIRAAGILIQSPQGRVLLLQRSATGDHAGEWCCPGGKIEDGETPAQAAVREAFEEAGVELKSPGKELCTRISEDVHFTTFLLAGIEEFVPTLNDEHVAYAWIAPSAALAAYAPPPMAAVA